MTGLDGIGDVGLGPGPGGGVEHVDIVEVLFAVSTAKDDHLVAKVLGGVEAARGRRGARDGGLGPFSSGNRVDVNIVEGFDEVRTAKDDELVLAEQHRRVAGSGRGECASDAGLLPCGLHSNNAETKEIVSGQLARNASKVVDGLSLIHI